MNVAEFLLGRIDYERTATLPAGSRGLKLERMKALLAALGDPQDKLALVHVAGTKGKGSTATMIASMLTAAGYRTGLYTSPHLTSIEERIQVDQVPCPTASLEELLAPMRPILDRLDAQAGPAGPWPHGPTFFEITTAMAWEHFRRCSVQAAVIEVGLGGRLDSTNVCRPLASVITTISFDHMKQLGNTLAAIAREKAGIIKPGVPVVTGVAEPEPWFEIAARAEQLGCPIDRLGRDFHAEYVPAADELRPGFGPLRERLNFEDRDGHTLRDVALGMVGAHQAANAAVALATLRRLRDVWHVPESAQRAGLAEARCPARIETVAARPAVVIDAAHNVASIDALLRTLDRSFAARRRYLVFATSRDKDVAGMLSRLLPRFDHVFVTRYGNNPRALPPADIASLIASLTAAGPPVTVCATAAEAWQAARQRAMEDDLICIAGSFFLAAELRPMWLAMRDDLAGTSSPGS